MKFGCLLSLLVIIGTCLVTRAPTLVHLIVAVVVQAKRITFQTLFASSLIRVGYGLAAMSGIYRNELFLADTLEHASLPLAVRVNRQAGSWYTLVAKSTSCLS